ncbi:hypothetical protein KUTeg_012092, partial [Tegillarca granosa]
MQGHGNRKNFSNFKKPSGSSLKKLSIYHSWCDQQNVLPDSATVEQMADFFIYLHEKRNLKAVTISGYRSAIATLHKGWNGSSVSLNKDLTNLIKGIFNSNPNIRSLLPNWDLPSVLLALCDFPFEPIYTCELKILTWKTVFLLAVATASRVSELHALSVISDSLRFEKRGVRLLPNLKFLAKSQRLGKVWNPLFIPKFDRYATDERDLLLCPCRSLKEYVKRTKSIRGQIENLFLTYQKGFCKAAAKTTLSRWIVSLIRYVYDKLPDLNLGEVRAHDTSRLATSWALFNGASVQSILQAAHWLTETTFTSFYLKDVGVEDSFAKASVSAHNTRRLATSWALFYSASVQSILQVAYWTTETTFTSFYLKDVGLEDRFAKASKPYFLYKCKSESKHICLYIYTLSHLGFDKSTVSRAIQSVTDSLVRKAAQFIRWPSHDEKQSIKHGLYRLGGFPNTIGCIDGTHIRIIAPATADEVSYVNRKNFHSVNVQAVCDHQ